ncbi:MAG: pteridine reductase [Oceanospirillaceae bacterium]|nr:pteridine reductase [Oceanospirillaceae bacterium]MCP5335802.1 pteridine reductase [Oceanospirillaceae bacterium]MCP5349895.1 pteridine reductase [Oceanospirillaceae bacterium]
MPHTDGKQQVFISGAAKRLGAAMAREFHSAGYRVLLHFNHSRDEALALAAELNQLRADSCVIFQADLSQHDAINAIAQWVKSQGGLEVLINNASRFYPTPWGSADEAQWLDIFNSNVKAVFFLTQQLLPLLSKNHGNVINLIDIHAQRPLQDHPLYSASKAALASLTQSLAKDMGHEIRANGIAPGAILWQGHSEQKQQEILAKVPMQKAGSPEDIARCALFLAQSAYINGQIISVDGGRTLYS